MQVFEKKTGKALKCEPVDATELCSGKNAYYTKVDPNAPKAPTDKRTNDELKAELDEAGIEYPEKANKADLLALLEPSSDDE